LQRDSANVRCFI